MNYLFTLPLIKTPPSKGFGLYSLTHIAVLILITLFIIWLVRVYLQSDILGRPQMRKWIAVVAIASDLLFREGISAMFGQFDPTLLPLHLCGMSMFIMVWDAFKPNRLTRSVLYSFSLWGAVAALLFADWANRPILNVFVWQSFLVHALLIAYPMMLLVSGEMKPSFKDIPWSLLYLVVAVPIAIGANNIWGTNFWFLASGSAGSPLEPILKAVGTTWYIPTLFVLLMVLWLILYLPWQLTSKKTTKAVA
ncbi:MAG: YwaF family protein [Lactobacillaceae bacterium]|jgi:hypothetical integral membrane protein (TIGR02206 family)|nr:YwaF family protein [Lactobacillaceae bacterium]